MRLAEEKEFDLSRSDDNLQHATLSAVTLNNGYRKTGGFKMIQAPFGSYKEPDPKNRFFNPELAGGALLDIGTYAVSFARFFWALNLK